MNEICAGDLFQADRYWSRFHGFLHPDDCVVEIGDYILVIAAEPSNIMVKAVHNGQSLYISKERLWEIARLV